MRTIKIEMRFHELGQVRQIKKTAFNEINTDAKLKIMQDFDENLHTSHRIAVTYSVFSY